MNHAPRVHDGRRAWMIEKQLVGRGIRDTRVLAAFQAVHREAFVPEDAADLAYADTPLSIGHGQTISQPYIVALTTEALALHGGERVLEIGTGSGYAAAILTQIAGEVFTVERLAPLAAEAEKRLARLGFANVHVRCGDGSRGWPEHAPYDAIAVAASGPKVPDALLAQLAVGGRLVMPVGPDDGSQVLVRMTRVSEREVRREELADVRFVPLIGDEAWDDESQVRARADGRQHDAPSDRTTQAIDLMLRFAERTDVRATHGGERYLWTDAFAVCNFLGLARLTNDRRFDKLALALVEGVHQKLARFPGEARWLSGLPDAEAMQHPTARGLRIGKPLPERTAGERFDPDLEWERDGQYFHYLTKWALALERVTDHTGSPFALQWARELLDVAHRAFTRADESGLSMMWKMSIDLSRPLVPSMGQHDPLDGYVTCVAIDATTRRRGIAEVPSLNAAELDFAHMIEPRALVTSDPLGIGALLVDAVRLARIDPREDLLRPVLEAALLGLRHIATSGELRGPVQHRLAFRELGLAIGLAAVEGFDPPVSLDPAAQQLLAKIRRFLPLRDAIEELWAEPRHRATTAWRSHADINDVMLATALRPAGFLDAAPTEAGRE